MFNYYCNKCFRRQKYETALELFVSRCGHILCNDCVQENCCICHNPFQSVAIKKDMPASMAEYFSSPLKQYQHYQKILKFHHEQERRLVDHLCRSNEEKKKKIQNEIQGYSKLNNSIKCQIENERERILKLREYTAYYDRRLEQARYMTPPITSQPRPRFPLRSHKLESSLLSQTNTNMPKRFAQPIRPNIIFPRSPTLSDNNSSSVVTLETGKVAPSSKKARTPPPLVPFSPQKHFNLQF